MSTVAATSPRLESALRSRRYHRLLGDLLVDGGFVNTTEIDCALTAQVKSGGRLGDLLLRSGRIDRTTLKAVLRLQKILDEAQSGDSELSVFLNNPTDLDHSIRSHCHIRLGELLVSEGEISKAQMRSAVARQRKTGKPLGESLIEAGWLDSRKLRFYLDLQKGLAAAATAATLLMAQQGCVTAKQPLPNNANKPNVHIEEARSGKKPARTPALSGNSGSNTQKNTRSASLHSVSESELKKHSILLRRQALREKRAAEKKQLAEQLAERKARAERRKALLSATPGTETMHRAISHYANHFSLPADLIYAIIQTESAFNPNARSPMDAYGLMQVVPRTAGAEVHRLVKNLNGRPTASQLLDPDTNLYFGTAYLRVLLDYYFQDIDNPEVRTGLAIAAYNMGPSRLVTLIERKGAPENLAALRNMLRAHAPRETQDYLDKVMSRRSQYVVLNEIMVASQST